MDNFTYNLNTISNQNLPQEIKELKEKQDWKKLNQIVTGCLEALQKDEEASGTPEQNLKHLYSLDKAFSVLQTNLDEGSGSLAENAIKLLTELKSKETQEMLNLFQDECLELDPEPSKKVLEQLIDKIGPHKLLELLPEVWSLALARQDDVLFDFLISSKVAVDPNKEGTSTPLYTAISGGSFRQAEKLLKAGANPNLPLDSLPIIEACSNNDIAMIKLLIQYKANLNVMNENDETPLNLSCNQPEIFKLLCESGANPNHNPSQSYLLRKEVLSLPTSPEIEELIFFTLEDKELYKTHGGELLHMAVLAKNERLTRHFLERGCDPNQKMGKNSTLSLAIKQNNIPLVEELLKHGANPNLNYDDEERTPLLLVMHNGMIEIAKLLIDHGANIHSTSDSGESALLELKARKPRLKGEIYTEFKKLIVNTGNAEKLKEKYLEERFRKLGAMSSELGGISVFESKKTKTTLSELNREGMSGSYWMYKEIAKSLSTFIETKNGAFLKDFAPLLIQAFKNGAEKQFSEKQLEAIHQGEPCVIHTGFIGHAVTILFWKGMMVVCNRGAEMAEYPIQIFKIDSQLVTQQMLADIANTTRFSKEKYIENILHKLPKSLKGETSQELKDLEKICLLPPQKFGNCTWASAATSLYAMLILKLKEENDIKDTGDIAHSAYNAWLGFFQVDLLKNYLQHHVSQGEEGHFSEDRRLINELFIQIWNHQKAKKVNKEDVENLENLYLKILPKEFHEWFGNFKNRFI